ncbi:META domain-containing protein [Streptomyces sp. J2-1]|uniref:META domain-containing protein n=1 Tax=Streptomyces corallincola TaxID=2851888 RepID=UPI001C392EF6|nr:META domain-containing protein [Streptomyces corallincola]MBV2357985.1 META domain-containing protein [Streptomyces corallincola]
MNRYKQRIPLALATALLVPCALACGGAPADSGAVTPHPEVTGIDWTVRSVTESGTTRQAPASARLRLEEDGRAAGNLGCNGFGAQVTVQGDRITFGPLRTTRMACAPARMEFERALARVLTAGPLTVTTGPGAPGHPTATGTELTLTQGDGDRVTLARPAPE